MITFKNNTLRAFRNRNYALFFCGQSISQIGTWMQRTAVSWVIYSISHSAFMLGLAVFSQQFPSFLLSLVGGIVSDRFPRYKILLVTQTLSMIQAILLAVLILTNHYVIWQILALSAMLGMINAFDTSARQPMVHEMVGNKEDITNALALNSAMVNIAVLVGPALSGIVLHTYGAGVCFSLNAVSFIAVIGSLLLMKLPKKPRSETRKSAFADLSEGFQYLKKTPEISLILVLLFITSLFVLPYNTLLPIFAKAIYNGNAATFGYITSCVGVGAILGSLLLASLKKGTDLKIIIPVSIFILGIGLVCFSRSNTFPLAIPFAVLIGFASLIPVTSSITIVQMESAPHMRGRMMSYLAMGYFGMLPLGSLLIGAVSQKMTAPLTMLFQGTIALIIAILFFLFIRNEKKLESTHLQDTEMVKNI